VGEDDSDVNTIKVIIRRLAGNQKLAVRTKGYSGAGELLKNGSRRLQLFHGLGCSKFVVCLDADGADPGPSREKVETRIVKPSGLQDCCIVIPVQEIEAWLLADIEAATQIFTSWTPAAISYPEGIPHPKEHLERLSRDSRQRPRFSHAIHNERLAQYIDLGKVSGKCPSFATLANFVVVGDAS
jgi:hypothetical protein